MAQMFPCVSICIYNCHSIILTITQIKLTIINNTFIEICCRSATDRGTKNYTDITEPQCTYLHVYDNGVEKKHIV